MENQAELILAPESYAELFAEWSRHPEAVPFAGGTSLIRRCQDGRNLDLPGTILSLDKMAEMERINRSERFLEIGATVKLGRIIELRRFAPEALISCLGEIVGQQLRNMATIGGNVCRHLESVAALTALDAQYELRGAQSSRWVTASRFYGGSDQCSLGECELLSRIRIPLEAWDYSAYRKFAGQERHARIAVFLARAQKNTLSDIRLVCKTEGGILRDRNGEIMLIGKRLPLTRRIAAAFVSRWEAFLRDSGDVDEFSGQELVNFIEANVGRLSM